MFPADQTTAAPEGTTAPADAPGIPDLKPFEKVLGVLATLLATAVSVLGLLSSFTTLDHTAGPGGWGWDWPWLLPVGMDLAIPAFTIVGIFLIRLNMRLAWVCLVPRALTAATVYLNWSAAAHTLPGQVGHAVLTLLWVIFSEIAGHIYTVYIGEASGARMERIRRIRWLLAPISTAIMWRYMRLWETKGYQAVIGHRREAVVFRARMRGEHGWWWRLNADLANERLALKLSRIGVPIAYTLDAPRREAEEHRRLEQQRANEEAAERRRVREEAEAEERAEADRRRVVEQEERARRLADAQLAAQLAEIEREQQVAEQKRLDDEAAAEARRLEEKAAAARTVADAERQARKEADERRQVEAAAARAARDRAEVERRLAEEQAAVQKRQADLAEKFANLNLNQSRTVNREPERNQGARTSPVDSANQTNHEPANPGPTNREPRTANPEPVNPGTANLVDEPANSPRKENPANLGDRAAAKGHQVAQVLLLIDELGYDATTLGVVRERTGMTKTTAYHRLTEAREIWNQQASQAS